jgi:chemotaxis protein MotA
MKATTAIGMALALVGILAGAMIEGTNPMALFNIPALIIITGGTIGATMASHSIESVKGAPKLAIKAFKGESSNPGETITRMVALSEKARRNGLLALEEDVAQIPDAFTRKGLQLVVDGTDSDLVRSVMEAEVDAMSARHHEAGKFFRDASGFAPTIGILGTVMGLVAVLANLDEPAVLGPHIAGAFLATLYGVGSANVLFLPIANKLGQMSEHEAHQRTMVLDAVLSIQAGDNPRILAEKLQSYVAPSQRGTDKQTAGPGEAAQAPPADLEAAA